MLSNDQFFTLVEAATLLHCSVLSLRKVASLNKLSLYVVPPAHLAVYSVDNNDLRSKLTPSLARYIAEPRSIEAFRVQNVLFLKLNNAKIANISNSEVIANGVFLEALVAGNGEINTQRAPVPVIQDSFLSLYPTEPLSKLTRRFATYSISNLPNTLDSESLRFPVKFSISITDIYVRNSELVDLKKIASTSNSLSFQKDVPLSEEKHISKKLIDLHQLLLDLWYAACGKNIDDANIPNRDFISKILVEKYGFSKNLSDRGASIIKDSRLTIDETKNWHLTAPKMTALIECAGHWEKALRSSLFYPKNETMIAELMSQHGFPRYLAEAAVGILRPETAEKGGRPITI